MRIKFLLLVIFVNPLYSWGICDIKPEQIKPAVKTILEEVESRSDLFARESEFVEANAKLIRLMEEIDICSTHHRRFELENYHFSRWGEVSNKYNYPLGYLQLHISSVIESFELGIFRPFIFKIGLWREQAESFYGTEI